MTHAQPDDLLNRWIKAAYDGPGESFVEMIKSIADIGDTELLKQVVISGLLKTPRRGLSQDEQDITLLAAAAGLLSVRKDKQAHEVVEQWKGALSITSQDIQRGLAKARSKDGCDRFLALGADPLGTTFDPTLSGAGRKNEPNVLMHCWMMRLVEPMSTLLHNLAAKDKLPLVYVQDTGARKPGRLPKDRDATIFDILLQADEETATLALGQIIKDGMPPSWERALGQAAWRHFTQTTPAKEHREKHKLEMTALSGAQMSVSEWGDVLASYSRVGNLNLIGSYLSDDAVYKQRAGVLARMLDAGVSPDAVRSELQDGTRCTMLHTVVESGNSAMLSTLLGRGSDPWAQDSKGRNAFEIADALGDACRPEVRAALGALRARQAIQSILSASRVVGKT